MFSIICAKGKNNEIGKNNSLPWHIKKDLKFFKEKTMNHTIVMGKNTYLSLPKNLKGRNIIVISKTLVDNNVTIIRDPFEFIKDNIVSEEEIFICGGQKIYELFLPFSKFLYITEVDLTVDADAYFPYFNEDFYEKTILDSCSEDNIKFDFIKYKRK